MTEQEQLYEDLLVLRRNIRRHTWTKRTMYNGPRACLWGHINRVTNDDDGIDRASTRNILLYQAITRSLPRRHNIVTFNDQSTSVRRVQRLVEKAIRANRVTPGRPEVEVIDPHTYKLP